MFSNENEISGGQTGGQILKRPIIQKAARSIEHATANGGHTDRLCRVMIVDVILLKILRRLRSPYLN